MDEIILPNQIAQIPIDDEVKLTQILSNATFVSPILRGPIILPVDGYIAAGQTKYNIGTGFFLGHEGTAYKFSIGNPATSYFTWDGTTLTVSGKIVAGASSSIPVTYLSGTIGLANLNIAARGWSQTCVFSVTDADTIAWAAGVFTSSDGTAYNIGAGNTGNMAAKTYIYLDIGVSETAYQVTTTAATAVGAGKCLIAVAQNAVGEATYEVMGGMGGKNIDAANIVAGTVTANELNASITYAGSLIIDTAGLVRSGQTDYNTGTGWWIGNVTGTPKFSIGNPATNYLTWDGSTLTVKGIFEYYVASASDTLRQSDDTEKSIYDNYPTYTKLKEIKNGCILAGVRIKFDLKSDQAAWIATAKIYKNGVAIGTEQTSSSTTYATYSEDFTNLAVGDLIQLYAFPASATHTAYVRNFRLYYDLAIKDPNSHTNQDP